MSFRYLFSAFGLAASVAVVTDAALGNEFTVVTAHIDKVRQPKNIADVAGECVRNAACVGLMKKASAYFQVPVEKVVGGVAVLSSSQKGEGSNAEIRLPAGYVYCKSTMNMVSIVPKDGPRGSTFLGEARPSSVFIETWTPVQGLGGGRSWVEADITVLGVAQNLAAARYADGTCYKPDNRHLFFCRGGGCVDTEDRGQRVSTRSAPPAGGRNQ